MLICCRFGYDSAFIGTTIARPSFVSDFGISKQEAKSVSSNITSAFQAGAFFGAIFCYFCESHLHCQSVVVDRISVTEWWGRKWALQLNVFVFIIGATLMTATPAELSYICKRIPFSTVTSLTVPCRCRTGPHGHWLRCRYRHGS